MDGNGCKGLRLRLCYKKGQRRIEGSMDTNDLSAKDIKCIPNATPSTYLKYLLRVPRYSKIDVIHHAAQVFVVPRFGST